MLADAIRNPKFSYFFSFMLGVGIIVIIFHKECKEGDSKCTKNKAPSIEEVKDSIYVIGNSCYKFINEQIKCPDDDNIVESFKQGEFKARD